jgi:hypothetical protein
MKTLHQELVDVLDSYVKRSGARINRADFVWYRKALGKIADLVMWTTRTQRKRPKPRRDRHAVAPGD